MNVSEMFSRFIMSKRAVGVSSKTIVWYENLIGTFAAWLREQDDQPLTPELIEAYLVYSRERPKEQQTPGAPVQTLSDASIASIHRALRVFFKWCEERDLIEKTPMRGVKVKKPAPTPRRALRSEVDALLRSIPVDNWIDVRDRLIIHVLFFCGLRVGELVKLEAKHFDTTNLLLYVPGGKTGAGVVPLLPEVVEAYSAYIPKRPKDRTKRLFVSSKGVGLPRETSLTEGGVQQMLEKRCSNAGIRYLNPHSFRHGLAMHLLNERHADITMVQGILRHANIQTTSAHYAKWLTASLGDAYRQQMGDE